MKNLLAAGNRYIKTMDWTDMALLKLCVGALGVLIGLCSAKKHKKGLGFLSGFLFVFTFIPVMGKFLYSLIEPKE